MNSELAMTSGNPPHVCRDLCLACEAIGEFLQGRVGDPNENGRLETVAMRTFLSI
jgi:hypothetical protein